MKTQFLKERMSHLGFDPESFAEAVGVKPVTMKQNYLRGILPAKPVVINMKRTLKCEFKEFLYPDEIEQLDIAQDEAS